MNRIKVLFIIILIVSGFILGFLFLNKNEKDPIPLTKPELINEDIKAHKPSEENVKPERSLSERQKLEHALPIRILDFETSIGIKTDIFIYTSDEDAPDQVRLFIDNINYNYNLPNQNKNDYAKAYVESFEHALSTIKEAGANPKRINYVLGTQPYVVQTANLWVKEFNLL